MLRLEGVGADHVSIAIWSFQLILVLHSFLGPVSTHLRRNLHKYTYTYTHTGTGTGYGYRYMYLYVYIYISIGSHFCICNCIYTYVYIHIYISISKFISAYHRSIYLSIYSIYIERESQYTHIQYPFVYRCAFTKRLTFTLALKVCPRPPHRYLKRRGKKIWAGPPAVCAYVNTYSLHSSSWFGS